MEMKITQKQLSRRKTEAAILDAYGAILAELGYEALNINRVANVANCSRPLVYRYFGNMDGLTEAFARRADYWLNCLNEEGPESLGGLENATRLQALIIRLLQNQLTYYYRDPQLRELIAQSLDKTQAACQKRISDQRDAQGERLFTHTDTLFAGTGIPFRGIAAHFVGSNDFLPLHARNNRSRVCGLDPNDPRARQLYLDVIGQKIKAVFNRLTQ